MEEKTLNLESTVNQLAEILIDLYRQELTVNNINSSGNLYNTLRSQVVVNNQTITGDLILNDYWKYIESGRKPGRFPNINAIKEWIRQKPVIPDGRSGKLPTTDQLAFLISRKIATKGIQGKNILERAIEILEARYSKVIEDKVTQEVTKQVDNQLKLL